MRAFVMALAIVVLIGPPAFADVVDNVTLVIENDAGMVTQRDGMTQRECDAAAGLLSARKLPSVNYFITGNATYLGGVSVKSATSKLTSATCVTPTDKSSK